MNAQAIEQVKNVVKSHRIVPFTTRDVEAHGLNLVINNEYKFNNVEDLMNTLGIRHNLTQEIMQNPTQNWSTIRGALDSISNQKKFGCIVRADNTVATLVSDAKAVEQLNFDNDIDKLIDAVSHSRNEFHNIWFNDSRCQVMVETAHANDIQLGAGDDWKFGTAVSIGRNSNQFSNFFLRLICTNGMSTKENVGYRLNTVGDVGKQYLKFSAKDNFARSIQPRVDALKSARASFAEVQAVAKAFCYGNETTAAEVPSLLNVFPQLNETVADYARQGINLNKGFSTKQKKLIATNHNLYDIFNVATAAATHQRNVIGSHAAIKLNKVAADMFVNGPNLNFNVIDIYKN